MISIRLQVAAFKRNSSEIENSSDENSDSDFTSEDENQSSQDLLSQNFSSLTPVIRQTRPDFEDTVEMSTISSYLAKVKEIDSLNESSD